MSYKYSYSYSRINWFLKCPLYFKLKAINEVGKLKGKLKTYVKGNGSIPVDNEELGYNKVEKTFVEDTRGVVELMGKNGVPKDVIWEALYTNMKSIRKALRKAGKMELYEEIVENFTRDRVETHFKYTKGEK